MRHFYRRCGHGTRLKLRSGMGVLTFETCTPSWCGALSVRRLSSTTVDSSQVVLLGQLERKTLQQRVHGKCVCQSLRACVCPTLRGSTLTWSGDN